MFGAEAHADEARWNSPEQRIPIEEAHGTRDLDRSLRLQCPDENGVLHDHLHPLSDSGREFSAPLNRLQLRSRRDPALQRLVKQVRCGHGILNGEVDADATNRRHGVRRVADAQQPRPMLLPQAIDADGQQLHVAP